MLHIQGHCGTKAVPPRVLLDRLNVGGVWGLWRAHAACPSRSAGRAVLIRPVT